MYILYICGGDYPLTRSVLVPDEVTCMYIALGIPQVVISDKIYSSS